MKPVLCLNTQKALMLWQACTFFIGDQFNIWTGLKQAYCPFFFFLQLHMQYSQTEKLYFEIKYKRLIQVELWAVIVGGSYLKYLWRMGTIEMSAVDTQLCLIICQC